MTTGFEQRLLAELLTEVHDNPATTPASHRHRRLVVAGAVAAAAVTASVALPVLLGGGSSAQAYAVAKQSDGSVTVTIYKFDDAAGLRSQLAADGVKAVVDYTPAGKVCQARDFSSTTNVPFQMSGRASAGSAGVELSFTLTPSQVVGHTLVLEYSGSMSTNGPSGTQTKIGIADGPVAPCVLVDAPAGGNPPPNAIITNGVGPTSQIRPN